MNLLCREPNILDLLKMLSQLIVVITSLNYEINVCGDLYQLCKSAVFFRALYKCQISLLILYTNYHHDLLHASVNQCYRKVHISNPISYNHGNISKNKIKKECFMYK